MAAVLSSHAGLLARSPVLSSARSKPNHRCSVVRCTAQETGTSTGTSITPPPGFKPPEPKRFAVRPDKLLDILGASLQVLFRLGTGMLALGYKVSFVSQDAIPSTQYAMSIAGIKLKETSKLGPRPEKPIEIYEFESCPFCRKVREMTTVLDLDVLFYPCPQNGPTFRPKAIQMGGKRQFPYMVDPNTGVSMYESGDIIRYLANKYGDGTVPLMLSLGLFTSTEAQLVNWRGPAWNFVLAAAVGFLPLEGFPRKNLLTAGFAMIARLGRGSLYTPSKVPPLPLELWASEASPFCKIVREVLVELELPHLLHCCGRGSPKKQILYERVGHFQMPYLEDPNTGIKLFESAEIIDYLKATYAV